MNILLWLLVSFGMATIISISKIFEPVRNLVTKGSSYIGGFLACTMCMGFWTGIFLSANYFSPTGNMLFDGCLSCGTCWLLYCTTWAMALKFGG
jgi:hypothetical protein